jgi:hypothetical protein
LAIDPQNVNAMRLLEEFVRRNRTAGLPAGWQQYMIETGLRMQLLGAQTVAAYGGWTPLGALVLELVKNVGLENLQAFSVVRVCVRQHTLRDDGYAFGVTSTMAGWWVKAYPQLAAGRRLG